MEKKLYRVKVVLYVMAEDEAEACMAATTSKFDIFECTAQRASRLDQGWEDAIPYNSDGTRTCAEILAGRKTAGAPRLPVSRPLQPQSGRRMRLPAPAVTP